MKKGFGLSPDNLERLSAMKDRLGTKKPTTETRVVDPANRPTAETNETLLRIQEKIERELPERVTFMNQTYRREPHRGAIYFKDASGHETDVVKYFYERSKPTGDKERIPKIIYVNYSGEIVYRRGETANPPQNEFKKIKDPAPPFLGEIRLGSDGTRWRYESNYSLREFFSHSDFDLPGSPGWDSRWGLKNYSDEEMLFHFGTVMKFSLNQLSNPRLLPAGIPYYDWEVVRDND
jgi:hypothetical protein